MKVYVLFVKQHIGNTSYDKFVDVYATFDLAKQVTIDRFGADEWWEAGDENQRRWLVPLYSITSPTIVEVSVKEAAAEPINDNA